MGCKVRSAFAVSCTCILSWAWGKLAGKGGGSFEPPKGRGGGSGKGALVTGQSQEASLKPLMMTHQLRREAARKIFFQKKKKPRDTSLKMISALWGIILSRMCWGTSGPPPPPQPPLSACWGVTVCPSGVPVTGAQKGGGSRDKGSNNPPPPCASQFSPSHAKNPVTAKPRPLSYWCRSSQRAASVCAWFLLSPHPVAPVAPAALTFCPASCASPVLYTLCNCARDHGLSWPGNVTF